MLTKVCTKCGVEKTVDLYSKSKTGKYGRDAVCKECVKEYRSLNKNHIAAYNKAYRERNAAELKTKELLYRQQHRDRASERSRQYYADNRELVRLKQDVYQEEHKETIAQYRKTYHLYNRDRVLTVQKNYYAKNKEKFYNQTSKRRAVASLATPSWIDNEAVNGMYKLASLFNETGINVHVDHIVPLNSDLVCGLHCEANLQLLSASDNLSKGNRWWPDMW